MSMIFSRTLSAATAAYAGYCFAEPAHLPQALGWKADRTETGKRIAYALGVRDAAISSVGVFGDPHQVRRAMQARMFFDVFDAAVLAPQGADRAAQLKVGGTALAYGVLNLAALTADSRRVRKASQLLALTTPAGVARSVLR